MPSLNPRINGQMSVTSTNQAVSDAVFSQLCNKIKQDKQLANLEGLVLALLKLRMALTKGQIRKELSCRITGYAEGLGDDPGGGIDGRDLLGHVLQQMVIKKLIKAWNPWEDILDIALNPEDTVYVLPSQDSFNADPIESEPATQSTVSNQPTTLADRLATAAFKASGISEHVKKEEFGVFRKMSAAVGHELGAYLRERHGGSSQVADMLDGLLG